MAATTARKRIGVNAETGAALDVAPGKVWTLLATGPLNLLIKFAKDVPPVEIHHAATGLPAVTADGFMCDWDDTSLSIGVLTGNSVYYRASQATQFTYSVDA